MLIAFVFVFDFEVGAHMGGLRLHVSNLEVFLIDGSSVLHVHT
jgi:hypothetical protein